MGRKIQQERGQMAKKTPTQKLLHNIGAAITKRAKDIAPVDTGELQASIDIIAEAKESVTIGHKANPNLKTKDGWFYPTLVHEGTGIYGKRKRRIKPKKAKALQTPFGYFKSVAGQKAQPYLTDATEDIIRGNKMERIVDSFTEDLGKDVVEDMKKSFKIQRA